MPAPIFTRRHYCAVADLIRDADYLEPETRGRLVSDFGSMFKADNGRFDPERFRAAAYNGVKLDYPADSPCARLDALDMLSGLAETSDERELLARMRERIRNGSKPLASRKAAESEESERDRLEARGYRDGHAAATWFAPQDEESARRILRGPDEGDPEILDGLPQPRLGGEYADEPTWSHILEDEGCEDSEDGRPELLDAYQYAYACAVERELVRSCRYLLGLYPADLRR